MVVVFSHFQEMHKLFYLTCPILKYSGLTSCWLEQNKDQLLEQSKSCWHIVGLALRLEEKKLNPFSGYVPILAVCYTKIAFLEVNLNVLSWNFLNHKVWDYSLKHYLYHSVIHCYGLKKSLVSCITIKLISICS